MPRSLTNAYWIHVGELRERERIIALLDTLKCGCDEECDIVEISFRNLKDLIQGE